MPWLRIYGWYAWVETGVIISMRVLVLWGRLSGYQRTYVVTSLPPSPSPLSCCPHLTEIFYPSILTSYQCGKSAFARVAKAWVPEDQSMPSSIAARFVKRGRRGMPEVKALSLDTNFGAVDSNALSIPTSLRFLRDTDMLVNFIRMGAVYFAIDGRPDLSNVRRRDASTNRRSINKRLGTFSLYSW
jgi:hypothetical protein